MVLVLATEIYSEVVDLSNTVTFEILSVSFTVLTRSYFERAVVDRKKAIIGQSSKKSVASRLPPKRTKKFQNFRRKVNKNSYGGAKHFLFVIDLL